MKNLIIRICLAVLNSRWINGTPCRYGFIGNIDAFSYEHLRSEEEQKPGITVKEIVESSDKFRAWFYRQWEASLKETH